MDDSCEVDADTGGPADEACVDEGFRARLKTTIGQTIKTIRGMPEGEQGPGEGEAEEFLGDALERGWTDRGSASSLRRNAEVWKFALKCAARCLKPRKLRKKGAAEDEVKRAQVEAAEYVRDGLLTLGPTFVKLGQVVSTRTDVLPKTFTDVLKTLQV